MLRRRDIEKEMVDILEEEKTNGIYRPFGREYVSPMKGYKDDFVDGWRQFCKRKRAQWNKQES